MFVMWSCSCNVVDAGWQSEITHSIAALICRLYKHGQQLSSVQSWQRLSSVHSATNRKPWETSRTQHASARARSHPHQMCAQLRQQRKPSQQSSQSCVSRKSIYTVMGSSVKRLRISKQSYADTR